MGFDFEDVDDACERLSEIIHQDNITEDDIEEAANIVREVSDYYDNYCDNDD